MYNVIDAIEVLKKYNYYENAENEIRQKKIKTIPYNMQGEYSVYCSYLSKIWCELRDRIDKLQLIKCVELDNFPDTKRPVHEECQFAYFCGDKSFCENKCGYYLEKLKPLMEERDKVAQMEKDLKKTAERDFYLR